MTRLRRRAILAQALCATLLLVQPHAASAVTRQPSSRHAAHAKSTQARQHVTRVQPVVLRYTALQSLPRQTRNEFHITDRATAIAAADEAETRCARSAAPGAPTAGNGKVPPCLGLYYPSTVASPIKFHFDVALKSAGAPKDIFVGQCPAGSNNTSCNSFIGEAKAEQERLADTLDRQRRYPVATLGVALSF